MRGNGPCTHNKLCKHILSFNLTRAHISTQCRAWTVNDLGQKVRDKNPRPDAEVVEERRAEKHEGGSRVPTAPSGSLFALNLGPRRNTEQEMLQISNRFPFQDSFELREAKKPLTSQEVLDVLKDHISTERWTRTAKVAAGRTFSVVPLLEGCYDKGNIGAVTRTAEALGFGSLHYIRTLDPRKFKKGGGQRTSGGARKWMDMQMWDSTSACLQHFKAAGYFIAATHLAEDSVPISELDWSRPTLIIMGNESYGVSHEALKYADQPVIIPQAPGFVDSFNVSVAAAMILYEAFTWRTRHLGSHGDLDEMQQRILTAAMLLRHKDINAILRDKYSLSLDELEELSKTASEEDKEWDDIGPDKKRRYRWK